MGALGRMILIIVLVAIGTLLFGSVILKYLGIAFDFLGDIFSKSAFWLNFFGFKGLLG